MAVIAAWEDQSHYALRMSYQGAWTWQEFYEAMELAAAMASAEHHSIAVLHDLSQSADIFNNLPVHFRNWAIKMHDYSFVNVIIGANPYQETLFHGFKRFAGAWADGFIVAKSSESAQAIIQGRTIELKAL